MKYIDNILNGITMYRLMLWGLASLAIVSVLLSFFGLVSYGPASLTLSVTILLFVCFLSNTIFAHFFNVQKNVESEWITALILFFILTPVVSLESAFTLVLVGVFAMLSKYVLAINKKHVFNPAAISLVLLGLLGSGSAVWWIGSEALIIPTVVLVFLVLRKIQRFEMFGVFFFLNLVMATIFGIVHGLGFREVFLSNWISGPLVFFGGIMLTEPLTTPPTKKLQLLYGAFVGLVSGIQFSLGPVYSSPELALVIGNLLSFVISPRARLNLVLEKINQLPGDVYEFVWKLDEKFKYKSGQYLEWTLGHKKPDIRGNRRYFTIASSPTENELRLGVKFYNNPSTFKQKLKSLKPGDRIIASQLSGEFTLPQNKDEKMVWIAGGIGITPFRSMAKYLTDKKEKRDVVLLFSNKTPKDIVYKDILDSAEKDCGLKTFYIVNDLAGDSLLPNMKVGMINSELIEEIIPDFRYRKFYISGPHGMVTAFEDTLQKLGVSRGQIKVDFFPGFV
jgi:ferredoxin-NADP reductase